MGWEAQVSTPCSAYPCKPRPRIKCAVTEYSLRTKQTLQSGYRAVAKPADNLVMLCKFFCVYRPYKESISKEMNNDNDLNFHSMTK